MGKGKKQRDKHRTGPPRQEGSRSRDTQDKSRPEDSPAVSPEENFFTSRYSNRKVISNWDRYAEVGSGTADGSDSAQRLTQLLEQSVLLASQSAFQPSLDTLSEAAGEDDYLGAFHIDCELLAVSLDSVPLAEKLQIDPQFCQNVTTSKGNATEFSTTARNAANKSWLFMNAQKQATGTAKRLPHSSAAAAATVPLIKTANTKPTMAMKNEDSTNSAEVTLPLPLKNKTAVVKDDELLAELLAASTTHGSRALSKQGGPVTRGDHIGSPPPTTDDDMDQMLEELLAF